MVVLLWILLALLAVLIALLAVPVDIAFLVERKNGQHKGRATLCWMFGSVCIPLESSSADSNNESKTARKKTLKKKKKGGRVLAVFRTDGFISSIWQVVKDLLRRLQINSLSLNARIGLDDPADTGQLWGLIGSTVAVIPYAFRKHIAIVPEFREEVFEFDGQGKVRVVPVRLLWIILVFFLSPKTLRALYSMSVRHG